VCSGRRPLCASCRRKEKERSNNEWERQMWWNGVKAMVGLPHEPTYAELDEEARLSSLGIRNVNLPMPQPEQVIQPIDEEARFRIQVEEEVQRRIMSSGYQEILRRASGDR
jgi:hypothetical protein